MSKILCFVAMIFPAVDGGRLALRHPVADARTPSAAGDAAEYGLGPISRRTRRAVDPEGATARMAHDGRPFSCRRPFCFWVCSHSAEYAFGWDIGIDRIFVHGAPTSSEPFPGRPSPQTSLNFVLLGAALVLFNWVSEQFLLGPDCRGSRGSQRDRWR